MFKLLLRKLRLAAMTAEEIIILSLLLTRNSKSFLSHLFLKMDTVMIVAHKILRKPETLQALNKCKKNTNFKRKSFSLFTVT